jgi:hypothetical protein
MSISKEFKILSVKAEPHLNDKENVITYIFWAVKFELDGYSNRAIVETMINFDPTSTFIPVENLTKEQILSWAIAKQGGDEFLKQLEYHHTIQLQADRARKDLVDLTLPFVDGVTSLSTQNTQNNTDAFKLASDREYIRGLVLEALQEQSSTQISGT